MTIGGLTHTLGCYALMVCFAVPACAQSDHNLDALNRTVVGLYAAGRYTAGLPLAGSAVELTERMKGPDDPTVATALNNYGRFLSLTNHTSEAEAAYRRALSIDEAAAKDSPDVARDLNNLASLLQSSQRLPEAEKLYVRALAIDERTLGPSDRSVARDLNNIAVLLRDEGKGDDAEPLQRRAIAILESLQRENPGRSISDLASALGNFAAGLPKERAAEAESLYRRVLELNEKELGAEHPTVAVNLNNLAEILRVTGKREEAEPLLHRALAIEERVLGPDHPTVAIFLNNLAKVLRDTNRPSEAESLINRALAIDQNRFGPKDPAVARDLKNLAKFYKVWNRCADAEPLMQRVIDILQDTERRTGRPVPEIGPALNFQAQLLTRINRLAEAEKSYREALIIDEKNYGPSSAQAVSDMTGLAQVLKATQRPEEAASLSRRADEITASARSPNRESDSRQTQRCLGYACVIDAEDGI
jgi:tetratricopeptide (TPR) repeat protein